MQSSNKVYIAAFIVLAGAFLWGLYLVLQIPLLSGQAFAEYSTYRADPKGLSVYFNALAESPGLTVLRNEHSLMQVGDGAGKTLFVAGTEDSDDIRPLIEAIEHFVQSGGRLVITFLAAPGFDSPFAPDSAEEDAEKSGKGDDAPKKTREDIRRERREQAREKREEERKGGMAEALMVNIRERWDFEIDYEKLPGASDDEPGDTLVTRAEDAEETLPEQVFWRSASFFYEQAEYWRVLYEREGRPVLMERQWDKGSIVLASDTYFLSNEAMLRHRYPALLTWLVGPNAYVLFDETHQGISRDPGIVGLMRRYRLTPVMIGFVVMVLLFIWKNSASLVPKRPPRETRGDVTESGKSAAAGLNSLLRRSTPRQALIGTCLEMWRQDYARSRRISGETVMNLRQLASQEGAQAAPDRVYNQIAAMLKERERT